MSAEDDLSLRQIAAAEALASAKGYEEAAIAAGVSVRSLYNWRQSPEFHGLVQDIRSRIYSDARSGVGTSVGRVWHSQ